MVEVTSVVGNFRDELGKTFAAVGEAFPELYVVTADVSKSTRSRMFGERWPDRFYSVGIAEADAVGIAAGIASFGGPVIFTAYGVFATEKPFEQIRNCLCYPNLNVKIVATHGGISVGEDGANAIYALGDLATIQMTPPGHRSYIVFDAHYEDHLAGFAQEHCRKLITPDLEQIDKVPEHYRDWHHGVQDAIDADVLKKRDSLEELERDLGFAPGVLVEAVEKWNACCERGEDDFMYPMPPEWLHAIKDPPFYGCRIGGNLYGTKAGLMINDEMQVISTKGRPIPGLYAGWHTAGGACGENSYIGDPILGSLLGDVSLAFCGGYLCGTFAVANEMKGGE